MRTRSRSLRTVPALGLAALALVVAGCGTEDGDPAAADGNRDDRPGQTTESFDYTHPTGADDVVLDVFTGGGFTSLEYQFALQPEIRVMGDGRVFLPAADDDEFDTHLRPLRVVQASELDLQRLLGLADNAGLLGEAPDYEMGDGVMVTDLPTTTVTIVSGENGESTYEHAAYGLSFGDGDTAARENLADFISDAVDLFADEPATPYEADQMSAYVTAFGSEDPKGVDVVEWTGPDLSGPEGCRALDATPELVSALDEATGRTVFRQSDATYMVTGALVLPGEKPCADRP